MTIAYREHAIRLDNVTVDGFGILRGRARIARIGVMDYLEDGEIVKEMRFPEDVIANKDTFASQVVTLDHPPEMVDSKNAFEYSKGLSGDVVDYVAGWLETNITVTHEDAVEAARTTHKQFSNGYFAELVDKPGVWVDSEGLVGEPNTEYPYDRIQKHILGNHIALVKNARAGSNATFLDSLDTENYDFIIKQDAQLTKLDKQTNSKETSMVKIIHKDTVLEIEGADAQKVSDYWAEDKATIKQLNTERTDSLANKQDLDEALREKSELQAKYDSMTAELEELKANGLQPEWFDFELRTRVNLWGEVQKIDSSIVFDEKLDSNALEELLLKGRKDALKEKLPKLAAKIDAGDLAYINALWDLQKEDPKYSQTSATQTLFEDSNNGTPTGSTNKADEARKAYIEARSKH